MKIKFKEKQGITLVALVITIVILLILAGIVIASLTGENGLITRAKQAREETRESSAEEKVKIEVLGSYDDNGTLDKNRLNENLENLEGLTDGWPIESLPATVVVDGYNVTINADGNVTIKTSITLEQAKDESILGNSENKYVITEDGEFVLPGGFKVADDSGNLISDGIVIEDEEKNQFVWIPVSNINNMSQCSTAGGNCTLELQNDGSLKCTTHNNNNIVGKLYATDIGNQFLEDNPNTSYSEESGLREPGVFEVDGEEKYLSIIKSKLTKEEDNYLDINTFKETMQKDYRDMAKSVAKYHGFYMGRYEMSLSNENTAKSTSKSVSLNGTEDSANTWYGLYAYGKTFKKDNVVSSMVWGSQYDAMILWMKNCGIDVTSETIPNNITANPDATITGPEGDKDIVKNIYDLYGGKYEFTLEIYNNIGRILRGGGYNAPYAPNGRAGLTKNKDGNSEIVTSRLTFYIK